MLTVPMATTSSVSLLFSRFCPSWAASSLALAAAAFLACGCGGAPAPAASPQGAPAAEPTASKATPPSGIGTLEPPSETPLGRQLIRFDDLGLRISFPPGLHAVGDDELAVRVRASSTPKVRDLVRARVSQARLLPLLTLARDGSADDWVAVTISVLGVPVDATAAELLDQQRAVMAKNLTGYALASPPSPLVVDDLKGAELSATYRIPRQGRDVPVDAHVRAFVREGMAILVTVVTSASSLLKAKDAGIELGFSTPAP